MYARGMGLLVGVRNRPSTFIIYVTEPTSLVVELVGPNDLYACQRVITGEPVQAAGCRQTIAMQIKGQSNQISVQYIPPAAGNYVLSLVHAGSHVLDSPYNIQVDDMVQALPSDDRSTSTTVKEMDPVEIYQIKCADSTPLQSSSSLSNFRMCSLKQLKPTDCATMSDQSKVSTYVNTFAALNVNDSKASAVETKASEPNHAITSTARPVERLDESMELEQDQHSIETVSSSLSSISNVKSRLMVDTLEDLLEEGDPMGSNVERLFCDLYQTVVDEKATTSNESDKENQVQNEQLIVASSSNDSKLSKANSKVLADKHSERAKQSRTIMTTRSSGLNLNPQARSYLQLQKAAATHSTKLIEKNQSQSIRRQLPNEMCKKSISPTSGVSLSRRPRLQSPPTPVKEHNVVTVSLSMQQQSIEPLMPNESMLNRFMNCASPDITNQSVSQKKNFWESLCSKNVKNTSGKQD